MSAYMHVRSGMNICLFTVISVPGKFTPKKLRNLNIVRLEVSRLEMVSRLEEKVREGSNKKMQKYGL